MKSKVLLRRRLQLRSQHPSQVQNNSYKLVYALLCGLSVDMSLGMPGVLPTKCMYVLHVWSRERINMYRPRA